MATTDYLSLLIAQRMAFTHDIQPLISPLFAPTQLPASERLRFVEDNEDVLAPPILPVQLLEQEQYSAVARTLFDGPLKRSPQFTTPSSSPASPSSDGARTASFRTPFVHQQQESEEMGDKKRSDSLPLSPSSPPSSRIVPLPAPKKGNDRVPDRSPLLVESTEKEQVPQNIPPGRASLASSAPAPQPAFSITRAEWQKDEALAQRELHSSQELEDASLVPSPSHKGQSSPVSPSSSAPLEGNKTNADAVSSLYTPTMPMPSLQHDPIDQLPHLSLRTTWQAGTEVVDIVPPSTRGEAIVQPASLFPARQRAIESPASHSSVQRASVLTTSSFFEQATYKPLVHHPSAVSVEEAGFLALTTPPSSSSLPIRPAQTSLVEQRDLGTTGGDEQSVWDQATAARRTLEQIAREESGEHEMPYDARAEQAPLVRVTIGRIDVRALSPRPPAAPKRAPAPHAALSLKEYLEQRRRGQS